MRKTLIAFSIIAALGAGTALAATPDDVPPPPPVPLKKLDTNGDGKIDRSEAAAAPRLAKHFDDLDKNKDGVLSGDELPPPPPPHGGPGHGPGGHGPGPIAKLDTNKDGRISAQEAKADPRFAAHFDKMDVNKDGFVDQADFELRMKQHRDEWFAKADTNKDGQLSKAEFDAAKPDRPMHGPGGPGFGHGPGPGPGGEHGHDGPPPPPPGDAPDDAPQDGPDKQ